MTKKTGLVGPVGGTGWGLVALLLFLLVGLALPLGLLFGRSLSADAGLDTFMELFTQPYFRGAILRTIRLSLIATAISVAAGYAVVLALRRKDGKIHSFGTLVLLVPILSGPLVSVVGLLVSFAKGWPGYTLTNSLRMAFGGQPGRVIETEIPVVVGMVHFTLPFVVLILLPVISNIPQALLDVSTTLGGGPITSFRRVIWPLSKQGVSAAVIISLALALSAFAYPQFLGGDRNPVLTTVVSQAMNSFRPGRAAAASVVLIMLGIILIVFYALVVREARRSTKA